MDGDLVGRLFVLDAFIEATFGTHDPVLDIDMGGRLLCGCPSLGVPAKDMTCLRSYGRKWPSLTVATLSSGAVATIGTHVGRCDMPCVVNWPHDV